MGVAGLWDVLKPAAKTRSLTELAVTEGFVANPRGLRGYRIGIDASIWFFHAEYGKEGENPVLRTLLFRCATLTKAPFLPLFVFDGPKRPDFKRGKRINKTGNKLIPGMKRIVEAFGFEWRTAPGEAEAELAYLNRIGVIDGILSDDVDNFLFGALTVIRNQSNNLSGNKANPVLNSEGKDDKNHTRVFQFEDIRNHPDIQLTRGGMILIGLMSGGDYQQGGLERCGITTAHALARCGFGDSLYQAALTLSKDELADFLVNWRQELRKELKTNSRGFMARKSIALSNSVPDTFPSIDVLLSYVAPITSESLGHEGANPKITWTKEPNVAGLAAACELYFEWGYREAIIKRFRTVVWPGVVLRILRRAALDVDHLSIIPSTPQKSRARSLIDGDGYGTPSKMIAKYFSAIKLDDDLPDPTSSSDHRLVVSISRERTHASTDGLSEYRLEISPLQLVQLAESGLQGLRSPEGPNEWASDEPEEDEDGKKTKSKVPVDPTSSLRLWMPTCMVDIVEKRLVREFREAQERKKQKKAPKKRATVPKSSSKSLSAKYTKSAPPTVSQTIPEDMSAQLERTPSKPKPHPLSDIFNALDDDESSDDELPTLKVQVQTKKKSKAPSSNKTESSKPRKTASPTRSRHPTPVTTKPALSDSDDELPTDIYQVVRPTRKYIIKANDTNTTKTTYISLSDDDDDTPPRPPIAKKTLAQTNKVSQTKRDDQITISAFLNKESREKHPGSQDDVDDHIHKSPRKSTHQKSPRQRKTAPAKTQSINSKADTLVLTDEETEAGYSGIQKPSIAPLLLARARAREKSAPSGQRRSPPKILDIIDLT